MKKSRYLETLAPLIASGSSIRDACKVVGCSEATGYAVSSTDEFRQLVAQIRTQAVQQAVGRLSDSIVLAVDTLRELLGKENEPSIRLNAAKALMGNLAPLSEAGELRARLDAIEGRATTLKVAR